MWRKRIAILVVMAAVAAVGAVGTVAPAARANAPGESIFGDFNADGFQDEAVLGSVAPNLCSVIVTYGAGPGVFVPPVVYIYLRPGGITNCPDIGTAFEVTGMPPDHLWLGWSTAPPSNLGFNRIVLDPRSSFQISATSNSPVTSPVFIGAAVFIPGARPTTYSYGKGGFVTFVVTPPTTTPGPERWCAEDVSAVTLRDFNGNGALDALLPYTNGCATSSNGVVVVLNDGSVRHLQIDRTMTTTWKAKVVFANSDKIADVQTTNQNTGEINAFIGATGGIFVPSPTARDDSVTITDARRTAIDVLANDYATTRARRPRPTPPRVGPVTVTSRRTVIYTPRASHGTTDRFVYQLTENGRTSRATVRIRFQG